MSNDMSRRRVLTHSLAATAATVGVAGIGTAKKEEWYLRSVNDTDQGQLLYFRAFDTAGSADCPDTLGQDQVNASGADIINMRVGGADIINMGADIINMRVGGPDLIVMDQGADIINMGADIINMGVDAVPPEELPDGAASGVEVTAAIGPQTSGVFTVACADSGTDLAATEGLEITDVQGF